MLIRRAPRFAAAEITDPKLYLSRRELIAGAAAEPIGALQAYSKNLGLAFQIVDDLLDVAGTTADTGKAVRADARKTTFVSFSGIDGARQLAAELRTKTAPTAAHALGVGLVLPAVMPAAPVHTDIVRGRALHGVPPGARWSAARSPALRLSTRRTARL